MVCRPLVESVSAWIACDACHGHPQYPRSDFVPHIAPAGVNTTKDIHTRLESFDQSYGWDRYNRIENDTERFSFAQDEILNMLGELGELANEIKKQKRSGVYKGVC